MSIPQTVSATEISVNMSRTKFVMPSGIDEATTAFLVDAQKKKRHEHLQEIRDHFEGGKVAISDKYFKRPDGVSESEWKKHRRLLTHVNLVKPSARCWTASVYSGEIVRRVVKTPWPEIITPWVESYEFQAIVEAWCENAVLYGTAPAIPTLDPDTDEISVWLTDPVYTHIWVDPININKVIAIAEVRSERIMYICQTGFGWMTKTEARHYEQNYGNCLPVAIAYGYDRRHLGLIEGLSMVADAKDWSIRTTDVAFNVAMLQKLQTRSTLVLLGDEETMDDKNRDGWSPSKALKMASGADAKYITPDAKIKDTIDILKQFIGLLATSSSIPADVLDATLTQQVSSAEAARIRAVPLVQRSKQLVPAWRANEQRLVLAMTALLEYHKSKNPVNWVKLKKRAITDIQITPNVLPLSMNEQIQNVIALVTARLISAEDAVRIVNQGKTPEQIKEIAAKLETSLQQAVSPQQIAQLAYSASSEAEAVVSNA